MAKETSYEVQIKRDGNWTISETFGEHGKDDALAVAKETFEELTKLQAVKVVKEVSDPDEGIFNDSVIFRDEREVTITKKDDDKEKKNKGKSFKKSSRSGGKKKSFGLSGFVLRFIGGIIFSLIVAGLCSAGAVMVFGGTTVFDIYIVGDAKLGLLLGVFVLTFLISVSVIAYLLMKRVKEKKTAKSSSAKGPRRKSAKPKMSLFAVAIFLVKGPFRLFSDAFGALKHQKNLNKVASSGPNGTDEKKPKEAEEEPLSPTAQKLKTYLMNFLNQALDGGKADKETLDNFNRFGVSLFLAGASEVLTTQGKLESPFQIKILSECLSVLKFKKSHAVTLAKRYEEYLMADSRYMQMFQVGRKAIGNYLGDETTAPRLLDEALAEWNKPKAIEKESGPTTVMFANMIRPPEDQEAQNDGDGEQLSKIHSRIVGEALAAHSGMEVKRIPDGIMATFSNTADAISAGVDMQKKTDLSNQGDPSLSLHMRIGINAGQPNAEESDLFGTVVRLAAQIVEKASADQIFVSEVVKGFSSGESFNFHDRGAFEIPGSEEPVKLFEVLWNGGNT